MSEKPTRILRFDYDEVDPQDRDGDADGLPDAFDQMMYILRARPETHYIVCSPQGGTYYHNAIQLRKGLQTGPWEFSHISIVINPLVAAWEKSPDGRVYIYLFMRWAGDELVSPELVGVVHPYTYCPRIA